MRIGSFEFRFWATLIVAAASVGLLSLGTWQWNKAAVKRQLIERFDAPVAAVPWADAADAGRYARVALDGRYLSDRQVLMDGMSHNGVPGVNVLSAFETTTGDLVIVNRGWRRFEGTRDAPVAPPAPDGALTITGRLRAFAAPGLRLGDGNDNVKPTWPRLAIYPSADEIGGWLGRPVADRLVLLDDDAVGGFVREWRPDRFPPERHVGYAVQWCGLALALLILYLLACRRPQR